MGVGKYRQYKPGNVKSQRVLEDTAREAQINHGARIPGINIQIVLIGGIKGMQEHVSEESLYR